MKEKLLAWLIVVIQMFKGYSHETSMAVAKQMYALHGNESADVRFVYGLSYLWSLL